MDITFSTPYRELSIGESSFEFAKNHDILPSILRDERKKINIETRRSTTPEKRVILVQGPC
ncbi:hypothetical protein P691DRAFT_348878 [Macrolepiota fuliginosa MF-IS2]|uniref:Uncharacterized protein n=1 Tax=Macrolepiota fuliginosa MF-IS2 TaxID=1400762 RepID=A0A9P6BXT2_9AGAR|nr:hypothetical protein P691DRAFT_348878 [Macrolepiota fuliginosa MF-IS2]